MKYTIALLAFLSTAAYAEEFAFEYFLPPDIVAETEAEVPYAVTYSDWLAQNNGNAPVDLTLAKNDD